MLFFQASNCSSLGSKTVGKKCSTLQRGRKPDCSKFFKTRVCVECVHQVSDAVDLAWFYNRDVCLSQCATSFTLGYPSLKCVSQVLNTVKTL